MKRSTVIYKSFLILRSTLANMNSREEKLKTRNKLFTLFGRYQESKRNDITVRDYHREYRELNREKIRRYNAIYGRIRRSEGK
mgnify:FL=1|jgi:hypothetical protein|tara:strand:+ start:804 stop:1052 length:249 start_codon:yes stop_codon:yes gene_type:complete